MPSEPWSVIALIVAAAGAVALAVLVLASAWLMRTTRAWLAVRADRQEESLRWMSDRLTGSVERFHQAISELGRSVAEEQGLAGAALQQEVREQVRGLAAGLRQQLADSQQTLGTGLSNATEVFSALQHQLGAVTEVSRRMEHLAAGVEEVGKILRVPKLRGLMGEHSLEMLLAEILPQRFWQTQHRFADGRAVDAVIRLGERLVPIDAKFPLESYRRLVEAEDDAARDVARRDLVRAVRGRIDEIAGRYIRPAEGTLNLALMFVPAESVYVEIVTGLEGVLEAALARRVLLVSPATLFAYLSTVALGLRGLELDGRAEELLGRVEASSREVSALREDLDVLGRHLGNAQQRLTDSQRHLASLEAHLDQLGSSV